MSKFDPTPQEILNHLLERQKADEAEQKIVFDSTPSDEKERVAMYLLDYCNSTGSPYDSELINDNSADPVMAVYYQLRDLNCYCDRFCKPVWDYSSDSYEMVYDENDNFIYLSPRGLSYLNRGYVWDPKPSLKRLEIHLAKEANKIAESALAEAKKANVTAEDAKQSVALLTSKVDEIVGKEAERNQLVKKANDLSGEANKIAGEELGESKESNSFLKRAGIRSKEALIVQICQAAIALCSLVISIIALCVKCSQ